MIQSTATGEVRWAFTVKEVAALIGFTEKQTRRLVETGRLKAVHVSERRIVITRHELCRFLQIPQDEADEPRQPLSLVRHQH